MQARFLTNQQIRKIINFITISILHFFKIMKK